MVLILLTEATPYSGHVLVVKRGCIYDSVDDEVAMISRLPKNIELFCKRAL